MEEYKLWFFGGSLFPTSPLTLISSKPIIMWSKKCRTRIIGTAFQCVSKIFAAEIRWTLSSMCMWNSVERALCFYPSTLIADLFRLPPLSMHTKLVHVLLLITVTKFLTALCLSWTSCARKKLAHLWPTSIFWDDSDAVVLTFSVGIVRCGFVVANFSS